MWEIYFMMVALANQKKMIIPIRHNWLVVNYRGLECSIHHHIISIYSSVKVVLMIRSIIQTHGQWLVCDPYCCYTRLCRSLSGGATPHTGQVFPVISAAFSAFLEGRLRFRRSRWCWRCRVRGAYLGCLGILLRQHRKRKEGKSNKNGKLQVHHDGWDTIAMYVCCSTPSPLSFI